MISIRSKVSHMKLLWLNAKAKSPPPIMEDTTKVWSVHLLQIATALCSVRLKYHIGAGFALYSVLGYAPGGDSAIWSSRLKSAYWFCSVAGSVKCSAVCSAGLLICWFIMVLV
ncbi:hypothetical protein LOK49_LG13G01070 [Camellia lanceoleosa]|uniref:Uncharacterized protein n=1 Tax=Camellia lanceoleosa TaxID=1840588 RepID=A0ACC0FMD4_9ERIC|nr:hypothetical protein LOK49_LG13G01070 [Camellia lanceoleosa]